MILDTNAVSAILAGESGVEARLRGLERHHIPLFVIGEYFFGIMGSNKRELLQTIFLRLVKESHVLYPDIDTARHYAAIRQELKVKGTPIPENDVWIAGLARQHQLSILSKDAHFDDVEGIVRMEW